MATSRRVRRDFEALEARRMQAARLFAGSKTQAEVARVVGVSRESARRWFDQWRAQGIGALRGAGRAGRKPRLTTKQLRKVDAALRLGPAHHGFETNLWTLPRVAQVIERLTGVEYHPGHVWRLLRQMGWSLQRPTKRARERNEEGVLRWKAGRWSALKKKRADVRPGSSSKTKAGFPKSLPSGEPGLREERPPS
jgi:transposase